MEIICEAPAKTYPDPCVVALHCAIPFWSRVANGATLPTHVVGVALGALVNSPTHHVTSLLVSVTGEGGLLNVPVALNCTWLVAAGGLIFTLWS
jgi:hypothetical protein